MALTGITNTILDGALGAVPETIENKLCLFGTAASGTNNTVYAFSDARTAQATLTAGPLLEAVAHHLAVLGEGPVYAVKVAATGTAGSVGSFTKSNGSAPTVGATGTPNDYYQLKVLIVLGGSLATATFQYSLDGGTTYSNVITTAATYAIANTGLTLTFAAGTYVAADYYTADCVAPVPSPAEVEDGLDALLASTYEISLMHIVGHAAVVSTTVAMATALDGYLATAATAERYMRCFIEASDESDATLQGASVVSLEAEQIGRASCRERV
jgi:hypothetical protein